MSETYRKIQINGKEDLPKEEGYYFMLEKYKSIECIMYTYYSFEFATFWLGNVDWYFLLIPDNSDLIIGKLQELVSNLTLQKVTPDPTTIESEGRYMRLLWDEDELRKQIASLQSGEGEEQSASGDYDVHVKLPPSKTIKGRLILEQQPKPVSAEDILKHLELHQIHLKGIVYEMVKVSDIDKYIKLYLLHQTSLQSVKEPKESGKSELRDWCSRCGKEITDEPILFCKKCKDEIGI
jgi:hypothetical protein